MAALDTDLLAQESVCHSNLHALAQCRLPSACVDLAAKLVEAGGQVIGTVVNAESTDSGHCKAMLRSADYVVPVSKTGLHRAQVLHTVLQALKHANNVTVELPHGAAGGYDPYPRNQGWTEHATASEDFAPVFFQAFGSSLLPRFGAVRISCASWRTPLSHAYIHQSFAAQNRLRLSTSRDCNSMRNFMDSQLFDASALGSRAGPGGRVIFITTADCASIIMARLLEVNGHAAGKLLNIVVVVARLIIPDTVPAHSLEWVNMVYKCWADLIRPAPIVHPAPPCEPCDALPAVSISYKGNRRELLLLSGTTKQELQTMLQAAFGLSQDVVGVIDRSENIVYPLSMLVSCTNHFLAQQPAPILELLVKSAPQVGTAGAPAVQASSSAAADKSAPPAGQPSSASFPAAVAQSVQRLRAACGLSTLRPQALAERFQQHADKDGMLNEAAFDKALRTAVPKHHKLSRDLVHQLFVLFDMDGNGTVDMSEVACGCSVLCSGTPQERATAAFSLFDVNGDGYLSHAELCRFFLCLFRWAGAMSSSMDTLRETAESLADLVFDTVRPENPGFLTLEEFQAWQSGDVNTSTAIDLTSLSPAQVASVLQSISGRTGGVSRSQFCAAMRHLVGADQDAASALFDRLDLNGDGTVDSAELISGLSVLCGGTRDEKVIAAFQLLDRDGDGYLSRTELIAYFTAVYRITPWVKSPEDATALAVSTADECLAVADENQDGQLSFVEFQQWYNAQESPSQATLQPVLNVLNAGLSRTEDLLHSCFEAMDTHGMLDRPHFTAAMLEALEAVSHDAVQQQLHEQIRFSCSRWFQQLDTATSGVVSILQVAGALHGLVGSSWRQVESVFSLFDTACTGTVQPATMLDVARIIADKDPAHRHSLAYLQSAPFMSAARVGFAEFYHWWTTSGDAAIGRSLLSWATSTSVLSDVRTLIRLQKQDLNAVHRQCVGSMRGGVLTRSAFLQCFVPRSSSTHPRLSPEFHIALSRLFDAFDVDGDGVLSDRELSHGMHTLWYQSMHEQVSWVFALFDRDHDDQVSASDMMVVAGASWQLLRASHSELVHVGMEELSAAIEHCIEHCTTRTTRYVTLGAFMDWCGHTGGGDTIDRLALVRVVWQAAQVASWPALKTDTVLASQSLDKLVNALTAATDSYGQISRVTYGRLIQPWLASSSAAGRVALWNLFATFDPLNIGVVDVHSLLSILILVASPVADDSVAAVCAMLDGNEAGDISETQLSSFIEPLLRVILQCRHRSGLASWAPVSAISRTIASSVGDAATGVVSLDALLSWYDDCNWCTLQQLSLQQLSTCTPLRFVPLEAALEILFAHEPGATLTTAQLLRAVEDSVSSAEEMSQVAAFLERLFEDLANGASERLVSVSSLLPIVLVFAHGTPSERITAAIRLAGDPTQKSLQARHLSIMLSSAFDVLPLLDVSVFSRLGCDAKQLADIACGSAVLFQLPCVNPIPSAHLAQWWQMVPCVPLVPPSQTAFQRASSKPTASASKDSDAALFRSWLRLPEVSVWQLLASLTAVVDSDGHVSLETLAQCWHELVPGITDADAAQAAWLVMDAAVEDPESDTVDWIVIIAVVWDCLHDTADRKVAALLALLDDHGESWISMAALVAFIADAQRLVIRNADARRSVAERLVHSILDCAEDNEVQDGHIHGEALMSWFSELEERGGGLLCPDADCLPAKTPTPPAMDIHIPAEELAALREWPLLRALEALLSVADAHQHVSHADFVGVLTGEASVSQQFADVLWAAVNEPAADTLGVDRVVFSLSSVLQATPRDIVEMLMDLHGTVDAVPIASVRSFVMLSMEFVQCLSLVHKDQFGGRASADLANMAIRQLHMLAGQPHAVNVDVDVLLEWVTCVPASALKDVVFHCVTLREPAIIRYRDALAVLSSVQLSSVIRSLSDNADDLGRLDWTSFCVAVVQCSRCPADDLPAMHRLLARLFQCLDTGLAEYVDWRFAVAGLCILFKGTVEERAGVIAGLFGTSADAIAAEWVFTSQCALYRVAQEIGDGLWATVSAPDHLAAVVTLGRFGVAVHSVHEYIGWFCGTPLLSKASAVVQSGVPACGYQPPVFRHVVRVAWESCVSMLRTFRDLDVSQMNATEFVTLMQQVVDQCPGLTRPSHDVCEASARQFFHMFDLGDGVAEVSDLLLGLVFLCDADVTEQLRWACSLQGLATEDSAVPKHVRVAILTALLKASCTSLLPLSAHWLQQLAQAAEALAEHAPRAAGHHHTTVAAFMSWLEHSDASELIDCAIPVRHLLDSHLFLGDVGPSDVAITCQACAGVDGTYRWEDFVQLMGQFTHSFAQPQQVSQLASLVFRKLRADGANQVPVGDVVTALVMFCNGSVEEKVQCSLGAYEVVEDSIQGAQLVTWIVCQLEMLQMVSTSAAAECAARYSRVLSWCSQMGRMPLASVWGWYSQWGAQATPYGAFAVGVHHAPPTIISSLLQSRASVDAVVEAVHAAASPAGTLDLSAVQSALSRIQPKEFNPISSVQAAELFRALTSAGGNVHGPSKHVSSESVIVALVLLTGMRPLPQKLQSIYGLLASPTSSGNTSILLPDQAKLVSTTMKAIDSIANAGKVRDGTSAHGVQGPTLRSGVGSQGMTWRAFETWLYNNFGRTLAAIRLPVH